MSFPRGVRRPSRTTPARRGHLPAPSSPTRRGTKASPSGNNVERAAAAPPRVRPCPAGPGLTSKARSGGRRFRRSSRPAGTRRRALRLEQRPHHRLGERPLRPRRHRSPTGRTRASGPSPKSSPTPPASERTRRARRARAAASTRPPSTQPTSPSPFDDTAAAGVAEGRSAPATSGRRTARRASLTTVSTRHEPDRSHAFQASTCAPLGSVASDNPDASSPGISNGRAWTLRPRSATTAGMQRSGGVVPALDPGDGRL